MSKRRSVISNNLSNVLGVSNIDRLRLIHDKKYKIPNKQIKNLVNADPMGVNLNQQSIRSHELESSDLRYEQAIYDQMRQAANNIAVKNGYYTQSQEHRAAELIRFAKDDTIADVIDKMASSIVQYDTNGDFVKIKINNRKAEKANFNEQSIKKIRKFLDVALDNVLRDLQFNRGGVYHYVERFLIEGRLAYEMVYDNVDKPKKRIDLIEINPFAIEPYWYDGIKGWIHQRKHLRNDKIYVHDNQIAFITWKEIGANVRMSYVEGLLRRYNMLKASEDSRLLASITAATFRTINKIPTSGRGLVAAATTLAAEASRLSENITISGDTGQIYVNGETQLKGTKQVFQAESDLGSPSFESIDNSGIQLDDSGLEIVRKAFYRATKLPYSRFDDSGSTWNLDPTAQLSEEVNSANNIDKIRKLFGNIILKPLLVDLLLEYPELIGEETFIEAIELEWVTTNLFREQLEQQVESSRIDHIRELDEFAVFKTPEGEEMPMLSKKLLMMEKLGYTEEMFERHAKEIDKELKQVADDLNNFDDMRVVPNEMVGDNETPEVKGGNKLGDSVDNLI